MLVAFDFDGTLSTSEMTVLLARECGKAEEVASITERAMNDEIDYATSLRERVALFEGLSEAQVDAAFSAVELRAGTAEILTELRNRGVHVAILTGGFEAGVEAALDREGVAVDTIVANRLSFANGALTGEVRGPLVEGTKDDALEVLCAVLHADLETTVAVGDGANDLPMLQAAGLAIGFDPKPAVAPACDVTVSSMAELRERLAQNDVL